MLLWWWWWWCGSGDINSLSPFSPALPPLYTVLPILLRFIETEEKQECGRRGKEEENIRKGWVDGEGRGGRREAKEEEKRRKVNG